MTEAFKVIIPARYGSTRLKGKLLQDIGGKPLLQHAYESADNSEADEVIIATDDERIKQAATGFGAKAIITSGEHNSGTDRIAEVVDKLSIAPSTIIINVQGDEYGLPPATINQLANALSKNKTIPMATLCKKIIDEQQYNDPDAVKVIFDVNQHAITFSRRPVPWSGTAFVDMPHPAFLHIGLYAYRADFLKTFITLSKCALEECESLEQLRALYHGYTIYVEEADGVCGIGVDNLADLELARKIDAANK